ncbi:MAG: glucose-6-phosphate isomerase family protein [Candidatus Daviesbacteria bacterium]|nr:glucose-6-phosphate isomerase family protein [Candidatus Daviesbacteria bacterium]
MLTAVSRQELKEVLMDGKSPGVKEPYFVISGEGGQNITVITPGTNGTEFNKTHGHFHTFQEVEVYHVVYGQGVLLMQRNDENGEAKEVRIVGLRPGSTVEVPSGYCHTIANVGKNYLVVIDNSPSSAKSHNSDSINEKQGLVYYIVDKKGEVGFDPNPNYRLHPQISTY